MKRVDLKPYPRTIDYDTYFHLYLDEESHPDNKEYYPTEYNKRKNYILGKWWQPDQMERRNMKIMNIWKNHSPSGHGLELGFNWGQSVKWLLDKYEDVTLDGIDFSPYMVGNGEVFKDVYGDRILDFWKGSISDIDKPDNHYDFINSCSVFEHLPDCVYQDTLKECYRTLKPNGYLGVYLDLGTVEGKHLRMDSIGVTKADLIKIGFKHVTDYLYTK